MPKVEYDLEEQVDRVATAMADDFKGSIRYDAFVLSKICDSPIEVMLGSAIMAHDRIDRMVRYFGLIIAASSEEIDYAPYASLLIPQYKWRGYRIDFAMRLPQYRFKWLFIECDGHNFHERTKGQAASDRSKDRLIQASGFPILRFTGSEIYRDPGACGNAVFDFIEMRIDDWNPPSDEQVG
jgi:hypothetical protein